MLLLRIAHPPADGREAPGRVHVRHARLQNAVGRALLEGHGGAPVGDALNWVHLILALPLLGLLFVAVAADVADRCRWAPTRRALREKQRGLQ